MSIRVSKPEQAPQTDSRPAGNQFEQYVERQLESTRQQVKLTEVTAGLLTLGLWILGLLLTGILLDSWVMQFGPLARIAVFALLVGGGLWIAWSKIAVLFLRRIHRLYAARMIESGSENFHNSLVNYLQVKDGGQVDREAIVRAISQRAARDLSQISPTEKVDRSRPIQLGFGLVGLVAILVAYTLFSPKSPWPSIARILNPVSSISAPTVVQVAKVTPGDTDVFFGQKLLVTAEIRGRHSPDEVRLVYTTKDGQHVEIPAQMLPTGTGGSYQLELSTTPSGIDSPLSYYVTANDGRSPTYSVNVKPNPAITLEQVEITPPAYSRLPPRTLAGQTEIEGLEGSKVKMTAVANMPIQVAWVELLRQRTRGRETSYEVVRTVELRTEDAQKASGEFTLSLDANRTAQLYSHYQVLFRTADGQRNPLVNVQPLRITPDLPPVVKVVRPFDREVAVPLNRSLELELQAEDPDFEISRLQLLLDHQGGLLLDEEVDLGENRKQQRITGTYRFEPRKLRLSVGDEVIFHGRASDNRVAALSGQLDPNVSRTENYKIRVTEPLETEIAESNQTERGAESAAANAVAQNKETDAKPSDQPGESTAPPSENQQANNQTGEAQKSTGESAGNQDAQAQMSESPSGDAGGEQSAQSQNPAQNEPQTADQPPQPQGKDQPSSNQESGQQAEQPEQPAGQEQPRQPEQNSGTQAGQQASGSQPGEQASGSSKQEQQTGNQDSGKSESNSENKQTGDTQANPQAAEKQTGDNQSSQKSERQSQPTGAESGGNSAPEKSNPETNPNQPANSSNPPQKGGQPPAMQQPSESNSQQPQGGNSGSQSAGNQAQGSQEQGNQSQGNQAGGGESTGQQSSGEQSSGDQSSGKSGNSKSNNPASPDNPSGQSGESADSSNSSGGSESSDPNANESAGSEADPGASANEPLDKSATDAERFRRLQERLERQRNASPGRDPNNRDPNNEAAGERQPSAENTPQPSGEKSNPQDSSGQQSKSGTSNQPEPSDSQGNPGESPSGEQPQQPSAAQSDRPQAKPPQGGGSGEQPGGKPGEDGSQQSGSGQPGSQQPGSQQSGGEQTGESSSGEQSGKSGSDSQSGSSSEQSGGQGNGKSGQQGEPGENSQSGGSSGQDSKSGQTGGQPGQGSSGSGQPGGQPSTASGSSGNTSGADNAQGSGSEISQRQDQPQDQPQDRRSSAGEANTSSAGAGSNESPTAENEDAAGAAEGNLEYSEKATDLVLDHLRNQANNPDPELLQEMNWTDQDLKDFLTRWEAMKKKANTGTPQEKKRYAEALRSLGLRPEEVRRNVLQSRRDQLNKLSEDGAVNRPPANLAEPFNTFLKNRNRVQKDK